MNHCTHLESLHAERACAFTLHQIALQNSTFIVSGKIYVYIKLLKPLLLLYARDYLLVGWAGGLGLGWDREGGGVYKENVGAGEG